MPCRGAHHSEETKRRIALSLVGNQNSLGCTRIHSEETKEKISVAHMGKTLTTEHRRNVGLALMGHRHSEETRRKIGQSQMGRVQSKQTRRKISLSKAGRRHSEMTRRRVSLSLIGNHRALGYKHSEATKRKVSEALIGNKNPSWRGGITDKHHLLRSSKEYESWRAAVYRRDNFTCQKSGARGVDLVAHHIYSFADYPDLRLSIENGITLSRSEHTRFHRKYGRNHNTREQLEEFLKP